MLAGEVVMVPQEVQKMGTLLMETREAVSQSLMQGMQTVKSGGL